MLFFLQKGLSGLVDVACADGQDQVALLRSPAEIGRDPQRSFEIMLLLEQINALGTTVMVVTHEKGLVDRFTKRVVAIDEGRVVSDGMDGYYSYEAQ